MSGNVIKQGLYLGLISGTSMDGIDVAIIEHSESGTRLKHYLEFPYPALLRSDLEELVQSETISLEEFGRLHVRVAYAFAEAARALLHQSSVRADSIIALGSHGQTVIHKPLSSPPHTLQIGDPSTIAHSTKILTVADFRAKDVAAGGQGAPLVPAFHDAVFHQSARSHAVINIGGIANITAFSEEGMVSGFDSGPGNTLMDLWIRRSNGVLFDDDGNWARSGTVIYSLLASMLADHYFGLEGPRSSGRDYFNMSWLGHKLAMAGAEHSSAEDIQATLLHLTATTIVNAVFAVLPDCSQLSICGGGTRNSRLMEVITDLAKPARVITTDELGIRSDAVEACAFAWLAARRLANLPGNVPGVTGATSAQILGGIYHPG